ncbi:sulfite exporter TauE/SafE family protein [Alkaliphilus serpentinus]|uniref:Probable membrane transporter protein n=1 Tax=Alkaliphilus serpentinus TaxID=1482731 RepID=A0A833M8M4_9FIRM|nr:sulfite exporter TauE/SafE family protein [Alkaliphilus serpentinus]KAB3526359.1 sulfite exporter TauE/SafE family protein [Alkaliphilus serpentinus]
MDNFLLQIILALLIIFTASTIQGITSFGFSLVALPLLGMLLPLKVVVPVLILFSLLLNCTILYHIRKSINLKQILILTIAGIISTPFGAYILMAAEESTLKIVIGVIIVISALLNLYGFRVKVKNEKVAFFPVGIMSGLLNGSVSLGGPPVVLFLSNQDVDKQRFRANLTTYFLILNVVTIPTYFFSGLITSEVLRYSSYLLPGLIIGTFTGITLGNRVNESLFKKLTLTLILAMGILSIASGL